MSNNRYFLVKESQHGSRFPIVTIRDRMRIIPATIDGRATRVYAPISDPMDYLDAYPLMNLLNKRGVNLEIGFWSEDGYHWKSCWESATVDLPTVTFGPEFDDLRELEDWQTYNVLRSVDI